MFDQTEGGMRAQHPLVGPVLTAQHLAARLPENTRIGRFGLGVPCSSNMKGGSELAHVTGVKEYGEVVGYVMLPMPML